MILRFVKYTSENIFSTALVASVLLILSLKVPLLGLFSGAIIGYVTLVNGSLYGIAGLLLTTFSVGTFSLLALGIWIIPLLWTVVLCVPVYLAAIALRTSARLEIAMLTSILIGVLALICLYLYHSAPEVLWLHWMVTVLEIDPSTDVYQNLENLAPWMPGSVITCMISGTLISLSIARGCQARLYNPGGFQKECHALNYGVHVAWVSLVVFSISILMSNSFAYALLMIILVTYLLQGLAVAHAIIKQRALGYAALVPLYIFLLVPGVTWVVSFLGWIDTWINFRQRSIRASK